MTYKQSLSYILPKVTIRGVAVFAIALVAFFHLGHVEVPQGSTLAKVFSVDMLADDGDYDGGGSDDGDGGDYDGGGSDGGDDGDYDGGGSDGGGDGDYDGGGSDGGDGDDGDYDGGGSDGDDGGVDDPGGDDPGGDDPTTDPPVDETPFCQLSASKTTITTPGEAVVLTWSTQDSVSRNLTGFGSVGATGSRTVYPTGNITYTLTATDDDGDVAVCPVSIVLESTPPPSPTCTITVSPTSVVRGGQVTVTWNTTNTSTFRIPGIQSGTLPNSGSRTVTINQDTTFTGTATGPGGTANCAATVTTFEINAPACTITVSPSTVVRGGQVTVTWSTTNTNTFSIPGVDSGNLPLSGSRTITINQNTTFTGTASGTHNQTANCVATVTVIDLDAPTCTITVSPTSVVRGGQVTVTWNTTNTSTFRIPGIQSGTLPNSGSRTVTINQDTTFTGTATGPGGTANCAATVTTFEINAPACTITVSPSTVVRGGQVTVTWSTTNTNTFSIPGVDSGNLPLSGSRTITINQNTTFTGTATGSNAQTANCAASVTVTDIPPAIQCTMTVSKSKVKKGEAALVTWTSTGATSVALSNLAGASLNGSQEVRPNEPTQYRGIFTNGTDSITCSAAIETEQDGGSCTGSCGGTRPKATVTLAKTPFDQPLASGIISLTQVPYTGFDADPVTAFIFWLVVLVWSAVVAYFVLIKGYWKRLFGRQTVIYPVAPPTPGSAYPLPIERPTMPSAPVEQVYMPQAPENLPGSMASTMTEPIFAEAHPQERKTEDRLYQERMLVSKGGLSRLAALTEVALDKVMYQAKGAYPREDGWILLSDERIQELLQSAAPVAAPTVTPEPTVVQQHTAPQPERSRSMNTVSTHTFLMALLAGDRSEAIALSRALQTGEVEAFFTEVAMSLDDVYRARMERRSSDHPSLQQAASRLSDDKLEALVAVMTNVMDQLYQNPQTAVKLAVAQALQITQ